METEINGPLDVSGENRLDGIVLAAAGGTVFVIPTLWSEIKVIWLATRKTQTTSYTHSHAHLAK